jgi:GDP-L-fucose synthase
MMEKNSKIYVAGHNGLAGSAIVRKLQKDGYTNLVYRSHAELDLRDGKAVEDFFELEKPEYVFDAAAKVGGIIANNTLPADFIYQNLAIQNNVIYACYKYKVKKLVFLGSSCIYPKDAPQPMKEDYLLTGPLEQTNIAYSVAKIAGIIMCQSFNKQYGTKFVSVMPCNTYGPNDHYDPQMAHVLPALIRRFFEAKTQNKPDVTLWGTGAPLREFIHVDDVADGSVFLMNNDNELDLFNLGTGEEITIKDLAELIQKVSGYKGELKWDTSKPNGMMRKVMDMSRLHATGWKAQIGLEEGVQEAYKWYAEHYDGVTGEKKS